MVVCRGYLNEPRAIKKLAKQETKVLCAIIVRGCFFRSCTPLPDEDLWDSLREPVVVGLMCVCFRAGLITLSLSSMALEHPQAIDYISRSS